MSDGRESVGAPIEEPGNVEDVVGQAHEGLAAAEAAGRDAVGEPAPQPADSDADEPLFSTPELNAAYAAYAAENSASADTSGAGADASGAADADAASADTSASDAAAPADGAVSVEAPDQAQAATPDQAQAAAPDQAQAAAPDQAQAAAPTDGAAAAEAPANLHEPDAAEPAETVDSTPQTSADASATPADAPVAAASAAPGTESAAPGTEAAASEGSAAATPTFAWPADGAAAGAAGVAGVGAAGVGAGAAAVPTESVLPPAAAPQPIFVQAPEEPRPRGNRGAAGAIGLLAALSFAVLYLGVALLVNLAAGQIQGGEVVDWLLATLGTWSLWVPTVVFFIAFWLLGAIINRGRWGAWVIFGFFVGLAAYGGHLLGVLFQAPFWMISAAEGAQLVEQELFGPFAIAAFVIGRELTIWFGAWVAARGRKVTELNVEARREYERTLEAGPQLAR